MAGEDDKVGASRDRGQALVPVTMTARLRPLDKSPLPRPDPSFVTHLLASREQVPQARRSRRASPSDAYAAYAEKRQPILPGGRTRQVI